MNFWRSTFPTQFRLGPHYGRRFRHFYHFILVHYRQFIGIYMQPLYRPLLKTSTNKVEINKWVNPISKNGHTKYLVYEHKFNSHILAGPYFVINASLAQDHWRFGNPNKPHRIEWSQALHGSTQAKVSPIRKVYLHEWQKVKAVG